MVVHLMTSTLLNLKSDSPSTHYLFFPLVYLQSLPNTILHSPATLVLLCLFTFSYEREGTVSVCVLKLIIQIFTYTLSPFTCLSVLAITLPINPSSQHLHDTVPYRLSFPLATPSVI